MSQVCVLESVFGKNIRLSTVAFFGFCLEIKFSLYFPLCLLFPCVISSIRLGFDCSAVRVWGEIFSEPFRLSFSFMINFCLDAVILHLVWLILCFVGILLSEWFFAALCRYLWRNFRAISSPPTVRFVLRCEIPPLAIVKWDSPSLCLAQVSNENSRLLPTTWSVK